MAVVRTGTAGRAVSSARLPLRSVENVCVEDSVQEIIRCLAPGSWRMCEDDWK